MTLVFFDIETGGLESASEFKCAVFESEGTYAHFTTVADTIRHILSCPKDATFVTFNGGGFDFWYLCCNVDCPTAKGKLARITIARHIDIMLDFLVHHGYRCSLQSIACELGESKSWDGASAAQSDDIEKIVAYCTDDVRILKLVFDAGVANNWLRRKTTAGKIQVWALPGAGAFRTVKVCMQDCSRQPPDQGWMTSPVDISKTLQWASDAMAAAIV
jgi:hypothetical protein